MELYINRLQLALTSISIVTAILNLLVILLGIVGLTSGGFLAYLSLDVEVDSDSISELKDVGTAGVILMLLSVPPIISGLVGLLLAVLLLIGASKWSLKCCMVWYVLNFIGLVSSVIDFVETISSEGFTSDMFGDILCILANCLWMWVVWEFMAQLRKKGVFGKNECIAVKV